MQNTGQGGEKKSYRVILLLVVGLAAFSSAMKELNQVHALTLETSSLLAQWSDRLVPAERAIAVETCENNQVKIPLPPMPVVPELPPMPPAPVAQPAEQYSPEDSPEIVSPEAAPAPPAPPRVPATPASKSRRAAPPAHDSAEVRVLLSTDDLIEKSIKDAFETDPSLKSLKAKNRRHIFITPNGKDVILKTLNRSINLRSAS
ncbi:MAG TPA: hypothetical protein VGJ37_00710 [Pyrinomonadaceae bacterium]|jgi:hypothetical protein